MVLDVPIFEHIMIIIYYKSFLDLEQMENLLFLGVPILRHFRVIC